jgi:hypothetical protein
MSAHTDESAEGVRSLMRNFAKLFKRQRETVETKIPNPQKQSLNRESLLQRFANAQKCFVDLKDYISRGEKRAEARLSKIIGSEREMRDAIEEMDDMIRTIDFEVQSSQSEVAMEAVIPSMEEAAIRCKKW